MAGMRWLWSRHARRGVRRLAPLVAMPLMIMQCAPSGCAPAPPAEPGFGDGQYTVGAQVSPGLYAAVASDCYWARLSGVSGSGDDIIVNDFSNGQHVVQIEPTDVGFSSSRCGRWTVFNPPAGQQVIGEGDWDVRTQMGAGLWVAPALDGCYWERASGYTHERDERVANDFLIGRQAIVQVLTTDIRFTSAGCGVWTPFNPAGGAVPIEDGDWDVRSQMGAGRWHANPTTGGCYWERANGFTHGFGEVIANDFVPTAGPVIVDVAATDARFSAEGCGPWTRVG